MKFTIVYRCPTCFQLHKEHKDTEFMRSGETPISTPICYHTETSTAAPAFVLLWSLILP